jgi:hypothetical protein
MTMGIDTRGVQGQTPVDPTATPIDTERRRERQDHRPKPKKPAPPAAAAPTEEDDAITIAPEGAKIDVRA